ncbi:hypothetical protein EA473_06930 [Natrarchaeobius chitinivorans]|uniref:Uncharacterized protein n=1 Tax=Natrarchaeobius chitinivorans TaxID=1679083 RepID=A0A3N6LYJ9_NATCH|nr:hypothetical protein EA473_06930 [Natrarchaeobius chitinivorans]
MGATERQCTFDRGMDRRTMCNSFQLLLYRFLQIRSFSSIAIEREIQGDGCGNRVHTAREQTAVMQATNL